jgi:hypothetical protein
MTEKEFIKRVKEMQKTIKVYIEKESLRLFNCGGVDVSKYSDGFLLPKIILSVTLKNISTQYRPFAKQQLEDMRNLKHF